ncbi:hypothetical protein AAFF_G00094740 [Aldrovandia affinis]|uniref:TNFR-Cys domain-containing protein n=1 Tax=Aldrovandia affinis TaxID=143900 RepID=A0AAD7T3U4_9TELE|nr:hypothetical protein AAFF_G00094740 [Aldrovandia affinis]
MRVDFTISWIFRGWVTHLIVTLCAQAASKPSCNQHQYVKDRRCCSKCGPGKYAFAPCTSDSDTTCRECGTNEYQPDWNNETKCLPQKFCDAGKGFSQVRPQNPLVAVPCQCKPGFQCSLSNCEYCEKIRNCRPGHGLTTDKSGRGFCVPCENGHFSNDSSIQPCRPWTNCKELGKTEKQPGSDKTDAVCGPLIPGISWIVVAVLSVIIVISLVILFLFCYKDKLVPLSENLRTCVQNLKRSRIQQETLSAPYSSSHGQQNCTLYEITCLIRQEEDPLKSLDICANDGQANGGPVADQGEGPVEEPVEVGENEDCSQAVAPGLTRACSCGGESGTGAANLLLLRETPLCHGCSACSLASCPNRHGSCDASQDSSLAGLAGRTDADCRQNEPCCCSIDSTAIPMPSSDCGSDRGLSLQHSDEQKLSVTDLSLDADPESAGHISDLPLTSGHVTGNHNTTFISNGQVMNFSGDVIVVYVSQNSQGGGEGPEEAFCSPVQEESGEEDVQGLAKPKRDTVPQEDASHPLQEQMHQQPSAANHGSLPVQEKSNNWPV